MSDVYGDYVAKYHSGTERVTIAKDGTFKQSVRVDASGATVENSGTWIWDAHAERIALFGCLGVNDGRGDIRPDFATLRGGCNWSVERKWWLFGAVQLGSDESGLLEKQ